MVPFLQSLDPSYLSPNKRQKAVNSPAFTLGSAEDSGFLQGVELAARLVSPCAGLPEGISSMLGSAISASAVLRFAWDQWAAMSDSASEGEPTDRPDKNDKEKAEKRPANERQQASKAVAATTAGGLSCRQWPSRWGPYLAWALPKRSRSSRWPMPKLWAKSVVIRPIP